ncbi:MAG: DUF4198 domain-containing protein [Sulfitobacter sp.]
MKRTNVFAICGVLLASAPMAFGHEFWIEPLEFQVQKDAPIEANLKNGELFAGSRQSFFEDRNTFFQAIMGPRTTQITGRMGDRPAIQLPAPQEEGLMVLAHEAAPSTITYREWAKFVKFVDHKDFKHALSIHQARGWPQQKFTETYTRHSKSLVAVGHGEGADRALGLETEFIALDNPYGAAFDGVMDLSLLYQGAPRVDAQVEIYARGPDDLVSVSIQRTDAYGKMSLSVQGGYDYMFDAVVLRPAPDADIVEGAPIWETLWATLTFSVPTP